mgnify:CR=1 FL=1
MDKKICFVALSAYPLLARKNLNYGGGPEVLQTFLAKELMKHGYEITFITYGEGEKSTTSEIVDGIRVIKVYSHKDAPYLNPVSKALYVWKAMKIADADIYYHHSGSPGIVSLFCLVNKKKFIYHVGSDACVTISAKGYHLYALDIRLADVIIVQTEFQKSMLMKNFNRCGVLIRNFFPLSKREKPKKSDPPTILWVGAMAYVKRPWLFLKLAKKIPEAKFQMIGGVGDEGLYKLIKEASKKIPNLNFLGYIPFYEIDRYFKEASILVNTSEFEGYPNAFIQAWMHYTPIVSLNVDPDEVICRYKLGFHSKTFDQMVMDIKILLKNDQLREEFGRNARWYVEREHNPDKIIRKYLQILQEI